MIKHLQKGYTSTSNEKYNCFKKRERHEGIIMAPGKSRLFRKEEKRQVGALVCRWVTNWWNVIWYVRKRVRVTNQLYKPDSSEHTARTLYFQTSIHLGMDAEFRAESSVCSCSESL